jgi:membrane protein insertase Oxa1/YidC/SpoIIIJ
MNPWTALVEALEGLITWTAGSLGGSMPLAIFVVTFVVRAALTPVTYPLALKTRARNKVVRRIRPQIKALNKEFDEDPSRLSKELKALHEAHGIKVVDTPGLLGALIQVPLLIAFFQAVYHLAEGTALASGGLLPGLGAAVLSALGVVLSGQTDSKAMLAFAALLPIGISVWLGSGIGIYLIAFYGASLIQGVLMKRHVDPEPAVPGTDPSVNG